MKIIALSDALDLVTRKTLELIGKRGHTVMEADIPIASKIDFKAIRTFRQLIKREKPDVVFSHSTSGLSVALLATLGTTTRVVGYRGTQHRIRRSDPANYLALLNPRVKKILCETADIVDILRDAGVRADKLVYACKPYALEWAQDCLDHPIAVEGQPKDKLRLITIGMFKGRPFKGLSYLLEAMRSLPEAVLTVVGPVDDADREAAPSNVTFVGFSDKATYYIPSHDLLMLPSTRDASPRTIREAQACGLPCIVSDIPGTRDLLLPGKTGLLVPAADPQAIVQAVKQLSDKALRKKMGAASIEHIRDHFDVDAYVDAVEATFKAAL